MTRIRALARRLGRMIGALTDSEVVLIAGLALLGAGLSRFDVGLGLAVPGAVLVAIALGFRLERGR